MQQLASTSHVFRARAAFVAMYTAIGALWPYLPVYYQSLGLGLPVIGMLGALSAGAGLVGAPLWGVAGDRFAGSRLVLPAACVLAATCGTLLALVGFPALIPVVAVLGFAMAGVGPILDARALEAVADDRHRYGGLRVWGSASFIVGALFVGWLIERASIHSVFLVYVPALLVTGLVGLGLRSRAHHAPLPRLDGVRAVLASPVLLPFFVGALITWSSNSAINAFFSIHLVQIGAPAGLVGIAWALGALVEIPLMIAFPALGARFGAERLLVAGAALLALRALLVALVNDPFLAVMTQVVHGAGFALLLVGGVTYVSRHAPQGAAATAQGVLSAATFGLGMILGPGVGGLIAGALGLEGTFTTATATCAIGAVALAWAVVPGLRRRSPEPEPG